MRVTSLKYRRQEVLPFLVALVPLLLLWFGAATRYGLEMDEGMVLLYPQLILDGSVPQRDFETWYTPGNLWFLAGVYSVFGNTIEVARCVGALYHLLLVLGIFVLAKPVGPKAGAVAALIAGLMLSPLGLTPFAWLLAAALLLWATVFTIGLCKQAPQSRFETFRPWLCGILAGSSVLVRQDVGFGMLLVLGCTGVWGGSRNAIKALLGSALALLPLAFHLTKAGWQTLWDNLIAYPIFHAKSGRSFPFSAANQDEQGLVCASFLAAGTALILARFLRSQRNSNDRQQRLIARTTLIWPLLFLTFVHQMLQRVEEIHVAFVAFLPLAMLWPCAVQSRKIELPRWIKLSISTLLVAAVLILCAQGIFWLGCLTSLSRAFSENARGWFASAGDRKFYLRSLPQQRSAQAVVDFLRTESKPGDRLVVGPGDFSRTMACDTFFYYLLYEHLKPGTYFLEFNPGSANRPSSRLADDVADADWVILNAFYRTWREPNRSHLPGDQLADEVLRERYDQVFRSRDYEVYRQRHPSESP